MDWWVWVQWEFGTAASIFDPNQKSPTMILVMISSPAWRLSLYRKNPEKPAGPYFNFYWNISSLSFPFGAESLNHCFPKLTLLRLLTEMLVLSKEQPRFLVPTPWYKSTVTRLFQKGCHLQVCTFKSSALATKIICLAFSSSVIWKPRVWFLRSTQEPWTKALFKLLTASLPPELSFSPHLTALSFVSFSVSINQPTDFSDYSC